MEGRRCWVSGVSPAAGQKNGRSDRERNFGAIDSATRLQGTKIKIHIISLCLRALVAKLLF